MTQTIMEMLTVEQKQRLQDEPAFKQQRRLGFPLGATPFQYTGHFHQVMGLPAPEGPITPSVSMRERRLRLILEEFLELVAANGFRIVTNDDCAYVPSSIPGYVAQEDASEGPTIRLEHIEGSRYDVVETADALGDLNVVVNGTAVEYGIPQHFIDYEVYCSNLTKLDAEGKPIVNHCQRCGPDPDNVYYSSCACDSEEFWLKPGVPIGKILKPDTFVPTNIPRVLLAYEQKEI